MSTTMKRIRDRLTRQCWVSTLDSAQLAELAIAAADVGDGRAAEELAALARTWRRIAAAQESTDVENAATYNMGAQDLEDRVVVLRTAPKLRRLTADRPDLEVAPASVAVEPLFSDHDILLTLTVHGTADAVRAARAWCQELSGAQVHLQRGGRPGDLQLVVTGLFQDRCSVRVAAQLAPEDPAAAALAGDELPDVGEQLRLDRTLLAAATLPGGHLTSSPGARTCARELPAGTPPATSTT